MKQIELQKKIFENKLTRTALLKHSKEVYQPVFNVMVLRNHSFEMIESIIPLFTDYGEYEVKFELSDYDDSITFRNEFNGIDLVVLWLDLDRYHANNVHEFLAERVSTLKENFNGPILFVGVSVEPDKNIKLAGIENFSITTLKAELGDKFFDIDKSKFTGTNLSGHALVAIAKDIALNYIPALLLPSLKCIVLDLDNTLYQGVLGEDGIDGIKLTAGHKKLHLRLLELKEQGFLLCIASKNNNDDVVKMLTERSDFPLKEKDFTYIYANWGKKSASIGEIIEKINIHQSSVLFIDDNYGELLNVHNEFPEIKLLMASDLGEKTLDVVRNYPGLKKVNTTIEDKLRSKDLIANEERKAARKKMTEIEYLASLNINLSFRVNAPEDLGRFCELSNKTNQFIFNYARYREDDVKKLIAMGHSAYVTVHLADKLSDSGIIAGMLITNKAGNFGILEECFVSCRALGRGLDTSIVYGGILRGMKALCVDTIKIEYKVGDRNEPALNFIEANLRDYQLAPSRLKYDFPAYLNIN